MPLSEENIAFGKCEFKPGQTVWQRYTHEMFDIIAVKGPSCWCWSVERCHYETISADDLLATDPNRPAEPVPQDCPFCGGEAKAMLGDEGQRSYVVCTGNCRAEGPLLATSLETIQAWNSIRVGPMKPDEALSAMKEAAQEDLYKAFMPQIAKTLAPEPTPKPCPSCGNSAKLVHEDDNTRVSCTKSYCILGPKRLDPKNAILAWNNLGNVAEEREVCAKIVRDASPWIGEKWAGILSDEILKRGQQ